MEYPMVRSLVALGGAVATALLLVSGVAGPADARSGHGHSGGYSGHRSSGHTYSAPRFIGPSRSYGNYAYGHRHHHGRFHRHIFVGVPFAYGAYPYYYDDGGACYWLRRRAVATGSPYWWSRYDACLSRYYGY
jgi:hypothetical protein